MKRDKIAVPLMNASAVCLGAAVPLLTLGRITMLALFALGAMLGLVSMALTRPSALRDLTIRHCIPFGLGLLFLVIVMISAALGPLPEEAVPKAGDLWLQGMMLTAALAFAALCPLVQARLLVSSFLIAFLFAILFALGDSTNCLANSSKADLYSWCVQRARHRGTAYAMLAPLMISLLGAAAARPDGRNRIGWAEMLLVFLMALGVFLSGSRSGWVGMGTALCLLAIIAALRGHTFGLKRAIVGVIAAFAVYLPAGRIMAPQVFSARLELSDAEYGAFNGREAAWRAAVEIWQQNPVFGVGVWNFRYSVDHFTHPHNFILELMSDTGMLGAGLAAVLLVILAVKVLRMTAAGPASAGAAAAVAAFFTASLAATSIFYGWWLCVLFGILTVGVAANRVEAAGPETS